MPPKNFLRAVLIAAIVKLQIAPGITSGISIIISMLAKNSKPFVCSMLLCIMLLHVTKMCM